MANQRSRGMDFALFIAIRQLVLQGLPTTSTRTSEAAFFSIAFPWPMKILPLMPSKSPRSIPGFARDAADEQGPVHVAKAFVEIGRRGDAFEQRKGAIVQLHHDAFEGAEGGRNFNERQADRLVGTEHRPGGNAKKKRVSDLTGRAGDGDFDG